MSTLNRIINRLSDKPAVSEKTASEVKEVATSTDPTEKMLETVRALSSKTASVAAGSQSAPALPALDKIAADTVAVEAETMRKQAELAGAAFMDGAMARLAGYDAAFGKTAGAADIEAAYKKGQEDLEKQAAAAYEEGQEKMLQEVHKTAAEIHFAGQQSARNVLVALQAPAA